ncbi:MAG: PilW family protein [Chlorobium sp.]|nr:PilW family protein [Chlorobium sp.]
MIMSCRKHNIGFKTNEAGFTLVELMIALVVSGLVMSAVVSIYVAQSRSYSELDDVANIQQDLRGALVILPAEIRLAGSNPVPEKNINNSPIPKIESATKTSLHFTMDLVGDVANPNAPDGDVNDANEDVAYALTARNTITNATVVADTNGDGIVDSGGANWSWGNNITPALGRQIANAGGFQPLADNVEALEFNYIIDNGDAGVLDNVLCNGNTLTSLAPTASQRNKLCGIQVSILARAANAAQGYVNTNTYTTASGVVWNPPDDNFRRRLVVTNIQCRNAGL